MQFHKLDKINSFMDTILGLFVLKLNPCYDE